MSTVSAQAELTVSCSGTHAVSVSGRRGHGSGRGKARPAAGAATRVQQEPGPGQHPAAAHRPSPHRPPSCEISIRRGFVGLKTDTRKYFSWKSQRPGCFTHLLSLIFILTTYENICTSNVGAQNRCTFQNITDSVFRRYREKMK